MDSSLAKAYTLDSSLMRNEGVYRADEFHVQWLIAIQRKNLDIYT